MLMTRNLLSADQVATRLGVQRATVYAYVSRGLLHRTVGDDGRTSWFEPAVVDGLARRGRPRARTQRAGSVDVVLASGLTRIAEGHLRYRGHDVADLVGRVPFEAVAELLWTGSLPERSHPGWPVPGPALAVARAATATLPDTSPIAARLAVAVAAVAAADESRGDLRPDTVCRKARTMLTVFARTPLPVGAVGDPSIARPVATELWPRLSAQRPTAARLRALDAALVLLADHELATSTLAARVAASTRANPFACVLAAIGAVSGPLHGRAAIGTHRILSEALATGNPAGAVDGALEASESIPGFGHVLYDGADPRATLLLEQVDTIASVAVGRTIESVRRIAAGATGAEPNIDFALGALALAGAMPFGATEGVFTIGRTAGWVAHVLEEYEERPLRYRPRAIYTGVADIDADGR
jgi:citrate synthase